MEETGAKETPPEIGEKHLDFSPLPVPASSWTCPQSGGHEKLRDAVPLVLCGIEQRRSTRNGSESKQPKTDTTILSLFYKLDMMFLN